MACAVTGRSTARAGVARAAVAVCLAAFPAGSGLA